MPKYLPLTKVGLLFDALMLKQLTNVWVGHAELVVLLDTRARDVAEEGGAVTSDDAIDDTPFDDEEAAEDTKLPLELDCGRLEAAVDKVGVIEDTDLPLELDCGRLEAAADDVGGLEDTELPIELDAELDVLGRGGAANGIHFEPNL